MTLPLRCISAALWDYAAMQRLMRYVARYRWRYLGGALCLFATATLAMAVPYLLKHAIDAIGASAPAAEITRYAIAIIVIASVQAITRTLSRSLIFNVGRDVEYDLRNDLFVQLQRLPLSFYHEQRTGDLMSRVINDVTAVRMLLGPGILNLVNTPLYYLYGVGIMLTLDARLTFAALLPYPILLWTVKRFSRRLMEHTLKVQEGLANLSSLVQENLSGIHVVRAYALEDRESAAFAASNENFKHQSMELARARGQLMPVMRTASSIGTLVVLCYGGLEVIDGRLGIGDLVAFLGYLNLLAWPTMAMGWMISIVQRGRAAMLRLEHIFAVVPSIRDQPQAVDLPPLVGDVQFRDVDFSYASRNPARPVLQDVSLHIKPGRKLALVGRTGSGKSTIASLLPRLFDVTAGAVLVDSTDVRAIPLAQLRRNIGFVPQDPFLFSSTVRDNIAFGVDHASEERIRWAATVAGVADDIESFPRGYDTIVGERGITLSGGQKQRLTLARAILTDPRMLILDDALSSVDTRTERQILDALREVLHGRTTIVIAHRLSTIADADWIAVVEEGRISEWGDHATLLARGGLYADMYQQQSLEEEIAEL